MIEFRHWLRRYSLSITLLALCAGSAAGQDYPTKPIRIIVPTQPGGTADLVSRVFAKGLGEKTKATVIVENKSGANGVIAANYVAKSEPDGYTIYLGFQGTQSVLQHIDPKLPSSKGLRPDRPSRFWSNSSRSQSVVCGKSVAELIAIAKKKPGDLSYASAGIGTTAHLVAEQFNIAAGVDIVGVMYRGAAPANQAVIAGDVPITFDNVGNAINNISSGLVRPLAITSTKRSPLLPNVPTMEEAGIKGVEADAWFAIFAPANTPPNIVAWLNAKANEVFSESDVSARFTALGMTLPLGSSESLGLFVNSETLRWGSVIQRAGIRPTIIITYRRGDVRE